MVTVELAKYRLACQLALVFALLAGRAVADPVPDQDCVIEPHTVVDLASAVEGIVESIEVERGDFVERDQVLVKLDAGVERAAVEYAKARAEASAQVRAGEANAGFAERRASRVGVLYEQKVVSPDQMDEAATQTRLTKAQADQAAENRRLAQLELRQAQEYLARHIIRSPIRGVVVQDYLSPGESVKDRPILRLAEIDPLRVDVIVPVAYFGTIVPGQAAMIRPESPREGEFKATVSIVDRVADAASGTFRVRLTLPNEDYSLPSGLKCRVAFGAPPAAPAVKAAGAPARALPGNAGTTRKTAASTAADTAADTQAEFPPLPRATPGGVARYARRVAATAPVVPSPPMQAQAQAQPEEMLPPAAKPEVAVAPVVDAEPELPPLPRATPGGVKRYARLVPAAVPPVQLAEVQAPAQVPAPVPVPATAKRKTPEPARLPTPATITPPVEVAVQAKASPPVKVPVQAKVSPPVKASAQAKASPPVKAPVQASTPAAVAVSAPADDAGLPFCLTIGPVASKERAVELRAALAGHVARLAIRAVDTSSQARGGASRQFWLDVESAGIRADEAMTRTLARVAPQLNLDAVPCGRLVAAR